MPWQTLGESSRIRDVDCARPKLATLSNISAVSSGRTSRRLCDGGESDSHVLDVSRRTRPCRQKCDLRAPVRTCKRQLVRLVRTRGRLHLAHPPARLVHVQLCVAASQPWQRYPHDALRLCESETCFVEPPLLLVTATLTRDNLKEISAGVSAQGSRVKTLIRQSAHTPPKSQRSSSATRAPYPCPPALASC